MVLHNRINNRILKQKLHTTPQDRATLSFYKYARIDDPAYWRDQLYLGLSALDALGRIYIATEGVNAQMSIPRNRVDEFRSYINSVPFLEGVRLNFSVEDNGRSFFKLKIVVKKKILADGLDDSTFDVTQTGPHVDAREFNRLAEDPNTIIVDMRNHYESEVGHFKNALLPDVDTFREELQVVEDLLTNHRDKNILMYCTGGIRCEKASAWMKHKGFSNVYQLRGGIIEYARQVKEEGLENKFIGKNFVFDERLGERITDDIISTCHQCGAPCDDHTNCKNDGCHLLFIQCPSCKEKYNNCCSETCAEIIKLPEERQRELRRGISKGRQVFRKGRRDRNLLKTERL
jgi:UPF0176 protein